MTHINMHGKLEERQQLRVGAVGCGSHSFRNIFPCYQFLPVDLVACCDLEIEKAEAFSRQFGAERSYADLGEMLAQEELDAVVIVTGYDEHGRPRYPALARQCLEAGVHVWIEKPPAAQCIDLWQLKELAKRQGKIVSVGFKKMFMPANQKAYQLMQERRDKPIHQILVQYPQHIPTAEEFAEYKTGASVGSVISFLDHLCHPMSALQLFMGPTVRCHVERTEFGSGSLLCWNKDGVLAHLALSKGQGVNGGMENTQLIGAGYHICVENNLKVSLRQNPALGYGNNPDFYRGDIGESSAYWEPEFSLGQMYNKGICLVGYFHELGEFVDAILEERALRHADLDDAIAITAVFEAIVEGGCGRALDVPLERPLMAADLSN